ncbi:hypothetical protein ABAC460_00695 [Asticcacaulis sp. AC460]|uniref:HvfC/BufC N-terminal domain-containing protein n=1 Tax=Asticcacaulis sp. AC460 TaxID=1282360 RepID=UPI0003C40C95|nr:DNA-binding domain-containing protein [Asticcacaulis sp. AC460]ESQ93250.1 hypothetical protein ABAC460_00695 [Asticcacaulis sp. AC460]
MFDTRSLSDFQRDFLDAVTAVKAPEHPGLRVHHDTWFLGLIACLEDVYPAAKAVLGEEAFRAFARDYIHGHPQLHGDRNRYGEEFAGFLTRHPHMPVTWLPALARYEWALHRAGCADDAQACGFEALLDPDACVSLHPSVQLVQLDHDIKAAYAAALAGEAPPAVRSLVCDALIGRAPDDEILHLCLAPLEAEFLRLVVREQSLMTVLDHLNPTPDDLSLLQTLLARLVQHGLFVIAPETLS